MAKCNFCSKPAFYRLEGIYYCKEHMEPGLKSHLSMIEEREKKKEKKGTSN
jgi:hypothetical protein